MVDSEGEAVGALGPVVLAAVHAVSALVDLLCLHQVEELCRGTGWRAGHGHGQVRHVDGVLRVVADVLVLAARGGDLGGHSLSISRIHPEEDVRMQGAAVLRGHGFAVWGAAV